ncbi:hypothetical protein [Kitasatospora sp. NPDC088346]|uniref:hypothetical protein n=1 Tax=Kitasatospora sp. NPDC088346 TaxID=3364073 RepID=UPI0038030C69
MPLTTPTTAWASIYRGPDWPGQISPFGTPGWERSAARWLRDLLPARYSSYGTMTGQYTVLARHVQLQLQHEQRALKVGLHTARVDLRAMGMSDQVIEQTIRLYATELGVLHDTARSVRLVTRALMNGSGLPRTTW